MPFRTRAHSRWVILALAGAAVLGVLALHEGYVRSDYPIEARAAMSRLLAGDLAGFATLAPAYGGSLVLRAPFALVPRLWGGGDVAVYVMLAIPGLLALALVGAWAAATARRRGCTSAGAALLLAVILANPAAWLAVRWGHAEDLLGAGLCVAAVLAAKRGRPALAGVLVGAAVASKPWAVVAVGPVLAVLPRNRLWAALVAGAVAAAFMLPLLAANAGHGGSAHVALTQTGAIFAPQQVWWFAGDRGRAQRENDRAAPGWVSRGSRPLLVIVALALAVAWRRRGGQPGEVLALLALVLLLRCLLDPWNNLYYHLPFIVALGAWEATSMRRWPLLTLAASAAATLALNGANVYWPRDLQCVAYLAWALPAAGALAARVFAPQAFTALITRVRNAPLAARRRAPVSA